MEKFRKSSVAIYWKKTLHWTEVSAVWSYRRGWFCDRYRPWKIRWMTRKECFTAGRDLINRQIRYFRAQAKCVMSANIGLTAFSEMIFGDSRVKFWSEIRCIPCIFYNTEWPLWLTFSYFHQLNVRFLWWDQESGQNCICQPHFLFTKYPC